MPSPVGEIAVLFGAQLEGFNKGVEEVKGKIEGLASSVSSFKTAFAEVGEALAAAFAVEKIAEWVNRMTEAGAQVEHFSQMLGLTAEEVSQTQFQFGAMGISSDRAAFALGRLERNMVQASNGTGPARAAFDAMGISVDSAEGGVKSLNAILPEVAEKFKETANGPEKTAIAIALFGRAGAEMIPFLNRGKEGLEEFNKILVATGATITGPMAAGMEDTAIATFTMNKSFEGLSLTMYEAFKPAIDATIGGIAELVQGFNSGLREGGLLNSSLAVMVVALDLVYAAFIVVKQTIIDMYTVAKTVIDNMIIGFQTMAMVMYNVVTGNFSAAAKAMQVGWQGIVDKTSEGWAKVKAEGQDAAESIKRLFDNIKLSMSEGLSINTTGGPGGKEGDKPKLPGMDSGKADNQMAEWRAALQAQIIATDNYYGDLKKMELDYWQKRAVEAQGDAKLEAQVQAQIFTLKRALAQQDLQAQLATYAEKQAADKNNFDHVMALETEKLALLKKDYGEDSRQYQSELRHKEDMERQHAQQMAQIQLGHANTQRSIDKLKLDTQKEILQEEADAGEVSARERYAQLAKLTEQEYQLDLQSMQAELNLEGQSPAFYARIYDQIEKEKARHELDMQKLTRQSTQAQLQEYTKYFSIVTSGFASTITGMLQKQQTFVQGMLQTFNRLISFFLEMIANMIAKWAAKEALNFITSEGFAGKTLATWVLTQLGITTAQETADATKLATMTATAVAASGIAIASGFSQIAVDAAVAAAGAMAAISAIPYIGPFLAPEVAAATYATTLGFASGLGVASAEGGMLEVPGTILSILHPKESVIPAGVAQPMRDFFSGKSQSPQHPIQVTYAPTIQALDGKSAAKVLRDNASVITGIAVDAARNASSQIRSMQKTGR